LCELVCTIPDTFGLSIDFEGDPDIVDGKAFARCSTIYSCDLVTEPAANDGGLFSSRKLPPEIEAAFRKIFDSPQKPVTKPMDNPPATPAQPAGITIEQINQAIVAALAPLEQRLGAVEAAIKADAAADDAPPAMKAMRTEVTALSKQFKENSDRLARRFGLEFAARSGANPVEDPANPGGTEPRKPFQVSTVEHNARQMAARYGSQS